MHIINFLHRMFGRGFISTLSHQQLKTVQHVIQLSQIVYNARVRQHALFVKLTFSSLQLEVVKYVTSQYLDVSHAQIKYRVRHVTLDGY